VFGAPGEGTEARVRPSSPITVEYHRAWSCASRGSEATSSWQWRGGGFYRRPSSLDPLFL